MTKDNLPDIMTAQEVALYMRVSRATGYNIMNRKDFPVMRVGEKRVLVRRDDFLHWLDNYYH